MPDLALGPVSEGAQDRVTAGGRAACLEQGALTPVGGKRLTGNNQKGGRMLGESLAAGEQCRACPETPMNRGWTLGKSINK